MIDFGQMFRTIWGQTCSERSERSARSERSEHEHCSGPTQGQDPPRKKRLSLFMGCVVLIQISHFFVGGFTLGRVFIAALISKAWESWPTSRLSLSCTGTMFVFGTFGTCGTFGTFGTCLALDCSEHLANIDQNQSKNCQNQPKTPKVNMLKSGDVSFDFGFEWCHSTQQQDM